MDKIITPTEPQIVSPETTQPSETKDTAGKVVTTVTGENKKPLNLLDQPLAIDILELGETYNHFNMKSLVKEIDSLLLEKTSDKKTYEELLKGYMEKVGDKGSIYDLVENIYKFMRAEKEHEDADKEMERILNGDTKDLTASELRRRIEHGRHNG
jgi:hypothetical protein